MTVHPTLANRGQQITVQLGEGSNAQQVSVINSNGQTIQQIPVEPGQHEVRINTSNLNTGMHFLNALGHDNQTTSKIIIK